MATTQWLTFPCEPLECWGLPWVTENLPHLWRLPRRLAPSLPSGVQRQLRFPAGARLRMRCATSELRLRVRCAPEHPRAGLDVYVDDLFLRTAPLPEDAEGEVVCFTDAVREPREIVVYLPLRHELQIVAIGIDGNAESGKPRPFSRRRPIVLYGSSIAQGVGAARTGMSYAAILGRSMDTDHVNLGFGGAGKAEPEVVELVARLAACCYLLDLGKSYGLQTAEAYAAMLAALRQAHPATPVVCVTAIFSSRESFSGEYADLSRHTRSVVRESVAERLAGGDNLLFMAEGETLLSAQDSDGLSGDGVHPNDLGHSLIAERLRPLVERALQASEGPPEPSGHSTREGLPPEPRVRPARATTGPVEHGVAETLPVEAPVGRRTRALAIGSTIAFFSCLLFVGVATLTNMGYHECEIDLRSGRVRSTRSLCGIAIKRDASETTFSRMAVLYFGEPHSSEWVRVSWRWAYPFCSDAHKHGGLGAGSANDLQIAAMSLCLLEDSARERERVIKELLVALQSKDPSRISEIARKLEGELERESRLEPARAPGT